MLAIVGPSRSGKTTLLNIIAGFLLPDEGSVHINNLDVATLPASKRAQLRSDVFGYVAQDYLLIDSDTAYQNIEIPLQYSSKFKRKERKQKLKVRAKYLA